eukprot:COSAG01_NODE_11678_length_1882_cov_1.293326_1_plen_71_part_10
MRLLCNASYGNPSQSSAGRHHLRVNEDVCTAVAFRPDASVGLITQGGVGMRDGKEGKEGEGGVHQAGAVGI